MILEKPESLNIFIWFLEYYIPLGHTDGLTVILREGGIYFGEPTVSGHIREYISKVKNSEDS